MRLLRQPVKIKLDDPKNRVNLVYTTDWHFSDVPPGRRGDNYRQALLEKLTFVRGLTEKLHGASLCGGDVFHHKIPNHKGNSLSLIIELINALRRFPQDRVFGSVGNHDISYDRMDSLHRQPLGLLIAVGAYHNLNKEPVLFINQDETVKVSVETFPYAEGDETIRRIMEAGPRQPGVGHRIGIVHAYGHPGDAADMFGTRTIGYNELDGNDFDLLLWGHDHSRHGVDEVGKTTHINLGSMARAAFNYDELDRPVVAAILSFQPNGSWQYGEKPIPVKPLDQVFVVADKGVEKVASSEEITSFFASMDEAVSDIEVKDPRAVIHELCDGDAKLESLILEVCDL
jgi:DNA repair exonuclease SbcCD nuclease subunit